MREMISTRPLFSSDGSFFGHIFFTIIGKSRFILSKMKTGHNVSHGPQLSHFLYCVRVVECHVYMYHNQNGIHTDRHHRKPQSDFHFRFHLRMAFLGQFTLYAILVKTNIIQCEQSITVLVDQLA